MWIITTAAFIDKLAADPNDAHVPAGKKLNVTAERGAELIALGFAEVSEGETPSDPTPKPSKPKRVRKPKAVPAPTPAVAEPTPVTNPAPAIDADTPDPSAMGIPPAYGFGDNQ